MVNGACLNAWSPFGGTVRRYGLVGARVALGDGYNVSRGTPF